MILARHRLIFGELGNVSVCRSWRGFYFAVKPASEGLLILAVFTPFLDVYWMGITQCIMSPPKFPATL